MNNDYWSRPRKERWIRFRKYLETESTEDLSDGPSISVLIISFIFIAIIIYCVLF